jgi:hypothetical protein
VRAFLRGQVGQIEAERGSLQISLRRIDEMVEGCRARTAVCKESLQGWFAELKYALEQKHACLNQTIDEACLEILHRLNKQK